MAGRSRGSCGPRDRSAASTRQPVHSCTERSGSCMKRGSSRRDGPLRARRGPPRTTFGPTRRGRSAFDRWRGSVVHVRDLRSELMLKLLFHDRARLDPRPLLDRQTTALVGIERALESRLASSVGFERTLALWRLTACRGAVSFVEGLLDSRSAEPVVYDRPVGYVVSPHSEIDGMPLQPIADTKGVRGSRSPRAHRVPADLDGFSHVWVVVRAPARDRGVGLDCARLPRRGSHGTFARSPHRPNPVGLSSPASSPSRRPPSSSKGSTSSTARRCWT